METFPLDLVMNRIRKAVAPWPKAAMFALRDEGFGGPFEQVVACVISTRTRDEATLVAARQLFAKARTPAEVAALSEGEIDRLIHASTFHLAKARNIAKIAQITLERFSGNLPCDDEVLLSLPGVGPKCANLTLGVACHQPRISVDIHVHRITNRWGYIQAKTPEKTMTALATVLPQQYWIEINEILVPFGKHICTGSQPKCSKCPVFQQCARIGVTASR